MQFGNPPAGKMCFVYIFKICVIGHDHSHKFFKILALIYFKAGSFLRFFLRTKNLIVTKMAAFARIITAIIIIYNFFYGF